MIDRSLSRQRKRLLNGDMVSEYGLRAGTKKG
jgi:hypothetical protein